MKIMKRKLRRREPGLYSVGGTVFWIGCMVWQFYRIATEDVILLPVLFILISAMGMWTSWTTYYKENV